MIDAAKIEELKRLLEQAIGGLEEGCLPCASCGHDEPTGDMDVLYELRAMQRILTLDLAASLAREGEDGELCKRLEIKADMIQLGEKIAYGSDSEIMREASARIRALAAENEALWRERNEATSCAACGGPYPNADCGHARNAADVFQPAPCRPDTARAESAESQLSALRAENERLRKALEPFAKAASDYERQGEFFSDNVELVLRVSVFEAPEYHNSTAVQVGDLRRARPELEAGHE